jgi:hypothetical protein
MSIVHDFKSINRKLNRQDQKAEFEAKEEQQRQSYANLYGVAVPFAEPFDWKSVLGAWGVKI